MAEPTNQLTLFVSTLASAARWCHQPDRRKIGRHASEFVAVQAVSGNVHGIPVEFDTIQLEKNLTLRGFALPLFFSLFLQGKCKCKLANDRSLRYLGANNSVANTVCTS